jgi:hypothetical protein
MASVARSLADLEGARLYQIDARDIQGGALGRQYVPVLVRADTRADAIARLVGNDFEPILDAGDLGIDDIPARQPSISMCAAMAHEIPEA